MPRESTRWYVLRWLCCVGSLVDGFVGTITLGFYRPTFALKAEGALLDATFTSSPPQPKHWTDEERTRLRAALAAAQREQLSGND